VRVAAAPGLIFEAKSFSVKCWSHDFEELLELAGLEVDFDAERAKNPHLDKNWETSKDWTEQSRYQQKSQLDAEQLFAAITDSINGVMPWIRTRW
jgi:hypothetical protein